MQIKSYYWVFVERFGSIIVKFSFMMLLARLLTPADFGKFAIINYIVATLSVVVDSGLGGSLVRKKQANEVDYVTVNVFLFWMALILFGLLVVAAPWISDYYHNESLQQISYVLGFCLIVRALTVVQVAHLTKKIRFREQAFCNIVATLISGVVAVVLAINSFGYWALVIQQLLESILLYLCYRQLNKDISFRANFSFLLFKEHFSFGSKLAFSSFLESGGTNLVVNAIAKKGGLVLTGSYSQVSRINEIFIGVMTTTIDKAAFPILVSLESERFRPYLTQLLTYVLIVLYYFIGLIFIVSKDVIQIALGLQWIQYDWILQMIMLCGYGQLIEVVMRSGLKAQGKSDLILKLSVFKFLCLMGLIYFLSVLGVQGVLLAIILTSLISAIAFVFVVSASADVAKMDLFKQIYPPAIASVVALFTIYMWRENFNNLILWVGISDESSLYYSFFKIALVSVVLLLLYIGSLLVVSKGSRDIIVNLGKRVRAKC